MKAPGLKCPECGEVGSLHLKLEDGTVVCSECEEVIGRERIEATALAWARLLEWLKKSGVFDDADDLAGLRGRDS